MFARSPTTPDEIRAEIAQLARRRDSLLKQAPHFLRAQRVIVPLMLLSFVAAFGTELVKAARGGTLSWTHIVFALVTVLALGGTATRAWRPLDDPKDLWAAADRVGYDGESPRELQARIDALEARLRAFAPPAD